MEEIEKRFEILRIAIELSDYGTIDQQIDSLRNLSTEKYLHEILQNLERKNFRQAKQDMDNYSVSIQDDFFHSDSHGIDESSRFVQSAHADNYRRAEAQPSAQEPASVQIDNTAQTPSPTKTHSPAPSQVSVPVQDHTSTPPQTQTPAHDSSLFDMASVNEPNDGGQILTLDDMLDMTKESVAAPRTHEAPEASFDNFAGTTEQMADEPETESISDDPLFTLDQDVTTQKPQSTQPVEAARPETREMIESTGNTTYHDRPETEPKPKPESKPVETELSMIAEEPISPPKPLIREEPKRPERIEEPEETIPQPESAMTPLFTDDSILDDDFYIPSHDTKEIVEEPAEEEKYESIPASEMFSIDPFEDIPEETDNITEPPPPIRTYREEPVAEIVEKAETPVTPVPKREVETRTTRSKFERPVDTDFPKHPIENEEPHRNVWDFEIDEDEVLYDKFVYMDQKFRNMLHQYHQNVEYEDGVYSEAREFIHHVSKHDYSELQVEAVVARYQELKEEGRIAEAAHMLIAAATTESTFAQFMLARELFKGDVLQQNYPEAFTQINQLAEEDYPEAICDLGQLYEYGIGIGKNKNHAILLYEEAAEMGIDRAKKHYERLKNSNPFQSIKSLTSSLLKKRKN